MHSFLWPFIATVIFYLLGRCLHRSPNQLDMKCSLLWLEFYSVKNRLLDTISIPRKSPNRKDIQQVLPRLLLSDLQKEIPLPSWRRPPKGLPRYLIISVISYFIWSILYGPYYMDHIIWLKIEPRIDRAAVWIGPIWEGINSLYWFQKWPLRKLVTRS